MTSTQVEVGPPPVAVGGARDPRGFKRRWVRALVVGELVGFVPPAVTGASLAVLGAPDLALVIGLTLAGLLEGLAIGVMQARVLRRYAPVVNARGWIAATVAGAGAAWLAGMGGSAAAQAQVLPLGLMLLLFVPAGIAGFLAMGALQWLVIRDDLPHSARWIWVSSAAWLVGVMIPVVALSVVPNGWPAIVHVLVGVAAAVAMGLAVGVLTGRTMQRLLARGPDAASPRT